jgi:hypothetical protein
VSSASLRTTLRIGCAQLWQAGRDEHDPTLGTS